MPTISPILAAGTNDGLPLTISVSRPAAGEKIDGRRLLGEQRIKPAPSLPPRDVT